MHLIFFTVSGTKSFLSRLLRELNQPCSEMNVFVVVRVHVAVGVLVELDVDPVACVQRVHQHHGVRRRLGLAPRTAAVGVQGV